MATYYVGSGGNNVNDGLSWANRKLTLNGAEDIPVAAGDTVYVGPGTYRELLTVDVSGTSGNPITYIGDYAGTLTSGTKGVVRITGSNNDQTATRAQCILDNAGAINYRTFRGFLMDSVTGTNSSIVFGNGTGTNWVIEQCAFAHTGASAHGMLRVSGAAQASWTVRNCYFNFGGTQDKSIYFDHSVNVDDSGHIVESCIIRGQGHTNAAGLRIDRVGGITIRNCEIAHVRSGVVMAIGIAAGQTITINNCLFTSCDIAVSSTSLGFVVEDYNNFYNNSTNRTNTAVGANSTALIPLFDSRWFFETVGGGDMVTPFDLASYSQLINVAGTSPPTTDMRFTSVIGAQREWGPLEYDSTLEIGPGSGGSVGGGPVIGSRIIRGLGAL